MAEQLVYTAQETADLCRVSVWLVAEWTRTGVLPRLPSRRIRIPAAAAKEMAAWLRSVEDARPPLGPIAEAMANCDLLPLDHGPKTCNGCGAALTGLRRRWCSDGCASRWWVNHAWSFARPYAIQIAGGSDAPCGRCGLIVGYSAEVNHIVPRNGQGYGRGCHHHQDNLEVLCHDCHAVETARQGRERRT